MHLLLQRTSLFVSFDNIPDNIFREMLHLHPGPKLRKIEKEEKQPIVGI